MNTFRHFFEKITSINARYHEPRIEMSGGVRISLMVLRIYLLALVVLMIYKFVLIVRQQ
jgi:hypothetical protein